MNPRDIPEVVAELIYEMHGVRSEPKAVNSRLDRLEETTGQMVAEQRGRREEQRGTREEVHPLPDRIGAAMFKPLEPFLNRLLTHDDQLKSRDARLGRLKNPSNP